MKLWKTQLQQKINSMSSIKELFPGNDSQSWPTSVPIECDKSHMTVITPFIARILSVSIPISTYNYRQVMTYWANTRGPAECRLSVSRIKANALVMRKIVCVIFFCAFHTCKQLGSTSRNQDCFFVCGTDTLFTIHVSPGMDNTGVWEFLFPADFLIFENFHVPKFQPISGIFTQFHAVFPRFLSVASHTWAGSTAPTVPGNDKENWGNHHIDVIRIWGGIFVLKPCSWGLRKKSFYLSLY